jgi:hypothetical protein
VTITLDLPQALEQDLSAEAARLGLSLPEYAIRILAATTAAKDLPRTGAELVAYWQRERLVGCRSDITDSQQHARAIREAAQHRAKE